MLLSLYSVLFFVALSHCKIFIIDDDCIKRCAEDLPVANWKAKVICIDVCKQPERSHQIAEDSNHLVKKNTAIDILYFLRDILNTLIMLSKGVNLSEDKFHENIITFLEAGKINLHHSRIKRDAEFNANLRGRARADTLTDFSYDSGGLSGNMDTQYDYEGMGTGNSRLSAGPLNIQGDFQSDVAGNGQVGLSGNIGGPSLLSMNGNWKNAGEANLAGKATANLYGMTIGGAGGKMNAKYAGDGTMIGGVGRGGLVGIDYQSRNGIVLAGSGAAGIGNPLVGLAAGIKAEGTGSTMSQSQGGVGLKYGRNGFGLAGKGKTQTNMAGGLDLSGGIGSYNKYSNENAWRGR